MVFSSLLFLFRFLPVVLAAYYILPKRCHNLVLFISSLVFYTTHGHSLRKLQDCLWRDWEITKGKRYLPDFMALHIIKHISE